MRPSSLSTIFISANCKSACTTLISIVWVLVTLLVLMVLIVITAHAYAAQAPHPASQTRNFLQQQKLNGADSVMNDNFGYKVALHQNTVVVGTPNDDHVSVVDAGSAYVFFNNGIGWSQQGKLVPDDTGSNDHAGWSVAVDGDTAVIGAPHANGQFVDSGAAYVFVRSNGVWSQQAKLTAPLDDANQSDIFGISVAISGETILVGASGDNAPSDNTGAAYVFTRSGTAWALQQKLTAGDADAGDEFGVAVGLAGDIAIVGAHLDNQVSLDAGAAYIFTRSGTTWSQQAKITASDGENMDEFGNAVAIDGTNVVIGAFGDDDPTLGANVGSAYIYRQFGSVWELQGKVRAPDPAFGDEFGTSVDISGGTVLVGSPQDDDMGTSSGSAYLFRRNVNTWNVEQKLKSIDLALSDFFGNGVAIDGVNLVIGAHFDDDKGINSGSAYVFFYDKPATSTPTPSGTHTHSPTPSSTPTATHTPTPNEAELTATASGPTLTPTLTFTPSSTPTITQTPTITFTPSVTDTPNTPVVIELLVNGSFETDNNANNVPDNWKRVRQTNDKRKCNVAGKPPIALVGDCAYQFSSGPGEDSRLNQNVNLSLIVPITLNAGDTISLSGFVWAHKGTTINTRVKVRVVYQAADLEKGKIDVRINTASTDYQPFSLYVADSSLLNLVLADEVASIKVQLINRGTSGKVRYDALSLQLDNDVAPIFPPEAAPNHPLPLPLPAP